MKCTLCAQKDSDLAALMEVAKARLEQIEKLQHDLDNERQKTMLHSGIQKLRDHAARNRLDSSRNNLPAHARR